MNEKQRDFSRRELSAYIERNKPKAKKRRAMVWRIAATIAVLIAIYYGRNYL